MTTSPKVRLTLPGLFTGTEIITAFRNAATFEQDENTKWECVQQPYTPGCYTGGHHYHLVMARPIFRTLPGRYARTVLGRKATWKPRRRSCSDADSEATIYLIGHFSDWCMCDERMHDSIEFGVILEVTKEHYFRTNDPDDPRFREYRGGYDRIMARFLINMIELAKANPRDQIQRQGDGSYWASSLIGVQDEAA
ncbi:MAG: hypothetical protein JO019_05080 [Candidatus Kaiserbacteria bacterium]|nr:hypothetical protein [Candidatus Kaiserbacteria bacterium]